MKDEIVTLETVILAKEKGFNIPVFLYYDVKTKILSNGEEYNNYFTRDWNNGHGNKLYSAPTQSLLQKWLREKYNIQMFMKLFYDSLKDKVTFSCDVIRINGGKINKSPRCNNYEIALEIGLQKALTLIKP